MKFKMISAMNTHSEASRFKFVTDFISYVVVGETILVNDEEKLKWRL